ncbi:plakophilin-4 isoform X1 [Electrophorus electricus]|uniref:Plakophilin 4 n=1 Tax=Electrophorus electricus TaxID=8005 RepID=A0A4W4DMN8_ELEEL|nr:plakophilin-4 isoform X1 [Electrophorus electricus]XP_035386078.1 plakophilin-4 isoform X1 [Electrophorus electricus]XP_035386085.1 plakophilin-4 isoform X1 [Electrophorus electricus]
MPAPKQGSAVEVEEVMSCCVEGASKMETDTTTTTTNILASVKEQELQFERLTRELEAERQIVANQLERCRLGAESPGAASDSSSEKSLLWRSAESSAAGLSKAQAPDDCPSPTFGVRVQGSPYSPELEQLSLRESEGSAANSRSSTQMNSYSDSGYQEVSGYYSNMVTPRRSNGRSQSTSSAPSGSPSMAIGSRAEGQASAQVASGRVMRRVSSVPSRASSPLYAPTPPPSRLPLGSSLGSPYGSPIISEPRPLASVFPGTTLPPSSSHAPDPLHSTYPGRHGDGMESPTLLRSGMLAQPQHYGMLGKHNTHTYDDTHASFGARAYDIFERIVLSRPDSLTGLQSSYSQHSQLGQEERSPDHHMTPVYEDRAFQNPLYESPTHGSQSALCRNTGLGTLQRTTSQCSTLRYQRAAYPVPTHTDTYHSTLYRPADSSYGRHGVGINNNVSSTRSPSIDSIHKDPREFAWRDPELPEVIRMLQHHFPSVQANAAAYIQHLCYRDNRIKAEVCRLGGIQHLVDLLDHKVLEVQRSACGALRNLVFGKATDDNKVCVRNAGGVPALLRLLRKTSESEGRELVTGVLWNLSSCDAVKMTIVRDALGPLTNTVIIPHSGWGAAPQREDHKLKLHSSMVLRNTTGCLRNLSSAGEESRRQMRCCEGLIDSLLYIIKTCVNTSDFDSKIVENCVCTLRNLSYRLELEMPPSRLRGAQDLDLLLAGDASNKQADSGCWGFRKKKKKRPWKEQQWDGVGPIPGFAGSPKGAEMLWHPSVVKPYLTLLAESSNPATLEGAAGSLQNLSAGSWRFAAYIRAAVRKEKGLPILVELLRMDNDRVVCSVATALRNMALDARNKELIGKYAMPDLVMRLPGQGPALLSDETVAAVCCALHEVANRNMENARALAHAGGIHKLVTISRGRGERYSMKVAKAAAQVLNTLWQYRDLRNIYKKDGWTQNHFVTPVSTLERDRYRSQPTLPTSNLQTSPVIQSGGSATSSPAMLGIREHRLSKRRAQSSMQLHNYYGDANRNKTLYTGSGKHSAYFISSYPSPSFEEPHRPQLGHPYHSDEPNPRAYDTYGMYVASPVGYGDGYPDEAFPCPVVSEQQALKRTNYVDFYSTTRRPSYRSQAYPSSPDSWV